MAVMMLRRCVACFVMLAWHALAASAEPAVTFERWYSLMLQDQRAGWAVIRVTEDDQQIQSASRTHIAIRRAGLAMQMTIDTSFVETTAGEPVRATVTHTMGAAQPTTQTMTFDADAIRIQTRQGDHAAQQHSAPTPAVPWLTPAASARHIEARFAAGDREVRYHTIDPTLGPQPVEVVTRIGEATSVEVMGRVVPARAIDVTMSIMPGMVMRQYVDDRFQPVRLTVALGPGMELDMVAADEALARSGLNPPEMMVNTLIRPSRPIDGARTARRAVYILRSEEGEMSTPPNTGSQRVEAEDGGGWRVTVHAAGRGDAEAAAPGPELLQASATLDHEHEAVRGLVGEALAGVAGDASAADKAEAIRRFVHRHVRAKDLSVGFATASETARTRQGDCTEHAVLLAAMLRAAGIPSRVATGLIYVERLADQRNVFGYHMWTQAWLDEPANPGGRWVDLDAVLAEQPFDATHLTLSVSAMNEPAVANDLVAMLPLLGRLSIDVVEVSQP